MSLVLSELQLIIWTVTGWPVLLDILIGFPYLTVVTLLIIIDQFFDIIPEFNYTETWSVPKVLHMEFISLLIWLSLFFIKLVLTAYPGVAISHLRPLRTFISVSAEQNWDHMKTQDINGICSLGIYGNMLTLNPKPCTTPQPSSFCVFLNSVCL